MPSVSKKALQQVADVHFIFDECKRLREEIGKKGMEHLPIDVVLNFLPHPNGRGGQQCTREGWQRLYKLARDAGRGAGLVNRVDLLTLSKPLGEQLVQRFQVEHRVLTPREVEKALGAAARAARKKCQDITHFIPCHLMLSDEPNEFQIGPVTFRSVANFRNRIAKAAKAFRSAAPGKDVRFYRRLLQDSLHYYSSFRWVAEVLIKNCDSKTSKSLARRAVTSALDCIHLMFGAERTDKMRIGGPRLEHDKRASLEIDANGKLNPGFSIGGPGQVGFREGWSAVLQHARYEQSAELIGIALESAVDPDLVRPLSRRFFDALSWFGEAVREESPAAQVIKFVTALERMVMTEEKDDIQSVISERIAALCLRA